MGRHYDAIVVGAGLGGLSVATLLARKGFGVLLLEKHNIPGGYATSFVRGRFEFEVALHELSDIGTPERRGVLAKYLDYLGVFDKVEFVQTPDLYRSIFPDLDLTLPKGRNDYTDALCQAFPHEADGIRTFIERIFRLASEVDRLAEIQYAGFPQVLPKIAALPFRMKAVPRYLFATWGEVLSRDVADERARAVISQYWGYFGLPPEKVSFFYFALALASYIRLGASHIQGRSQALSNAFIQTFEEMGGEVRFQTGVDRILTENGRTTGVITDAGEEFVSDIVVSNADPVTTCRDLIGVERIPESFFKKLRSATISPSSFNVYMGVNRSLEDFGVFDHETFVNGDYDFDNHYERMKGIHPPGEIVVTCYNRVLPNISPPGTSQIVLTSLMYGEPWRHVAPEEYVDQKTEIADDIIRMAETVLPGLREHTEVVDVSTPLTNMRYAGALGGSIYGFNNTPFNHTILRPGAKGPLEGLYFVGAWVQPGGGFSPAMLSGQIAGEMIAAKLRSSGKKG